MKFESSTQYNQVPTEVNRANPDQVELVTQELESFKNTAEVRTHMSSYPDFIKKYQVSRNIDLEQLYEARTRTQKRDDIVNDFLRSREHSPLAQFAEILPLLANKDGRLGKICRAKITKTAKPDDEGNGFVDLVCELSIDREYLKNNPELSNIRPTMTFALDMTTNPEALNHKLNALDTFCLNSGKKASVLCYENNFGVLGTEALKGVVIESEDYLADIAARLKKSMYVSGSELTITNDKTFDAEYRFFFQDFLDAITINAERSIDILKKLSEKQNLTSEQKVLIDSYTQMVQFLAEYKKILATVSE